MAVPPEMARTLPERLQELLGYNVYPPFLGYVDGRHPRRALDPSPTTGPTTCCGSMPEPGPRPGPHRVGPPRRLSLGGRR